MGFKSWLAAGLAAFLLAASGAWAERLQNGDLDLTIEPLNDVSDIVTNYDFPYQRLKLTNNSARSVVMSFQASCLGYETNPAFPQPSVIYLDPGESQYLFAFLDEMWGGLDLTNPNTTTRTWEYTFRGAGETSGQASYSSTWQLTTLASTDQPRAILVSGRVLSSGRPLAGAKVELFSRQRTRDHWVSAATTGADGSFNLYLPARRDHFALKASANGYLQAFANVDPDNSTGLQLSLTPGRAGSPRLTTLFSASNQIGFWRGRLNADGTKFLLVQGMENWADPSLKSLSQLRLYDSSGQMLWALNMGWQSWGAGLSDDGAFAAYVTSGAEGGDHFALVDATSGVEIWRQSLNDLPSFPQSTFYSQTSREITFNHQADLIALGTNEGGIYFIDRSSGQIRSSAFLGGGMVRNVIFKADDSVAYASAGDGYLYALDPSSGQIIWRAYAQAWAYTRGLALSQDEAYLAVAAKTGFGSVIRAADGQVVFNDYFSGRLNACCAVFHPSGQSVVFGGSTGGCLDLGGQIKWYTDIVQSAAFSPGGNYVICGGASRGQSIYLIHAASGTPVEAAVDQATLQGNVTFLGLNNDSSRLFAATEDGDIRIYACSW